MTSNAEDQANPAAAATVQSPKPPNAYPAGFRFS